MTKWQGETYDRFVREAEKVARLFREDRKYDKSWNAPDQGDPKELDPETIVQEIHRLQFEMPEEARGAFWEEFHALLEPLALSPDRYWASAALGTLLAAGNLTPPMKDRVLAELADLSPFPLWPDEPSDEPRQKLLWSAACYGWDPLPEWIPEAAVMKWLDAWPLGHPQGVTLHLVHALLRRGVLSDQVAFGMLRDLEPSETPSFPLSAEFVRKLQDAGQNGEAAQEREYARLKQELQPAPTRKSASQAGGKPKKEKKGKKRRRSKTKGSGQFGDLTLKLAVLNELMYVQRKLPAFELKVVEDLVGKKLYLDGNWVLPEGGFHGMIPEVRAYFEKYVIPPELLAGITTLHWEGGDEIQGKLAPNWDGEDSLFDLTADSAEDLHLLPSLERVVALHDEEDETIAQAFEENGVELVHPY